MWALYMLETLGCITWTRRWQVGISDERYGGLGSWNDSISLFWSFGKCRVIMRDVSVNTCRYCMNHVSQRVQRESFLDAL